MSVLPTEDMHDFQWLQSSPGDDRPFHKVCRGHALHNCFSRRDMQSSNLAILCLMQFQSDNGTALVEELTKELIRRSQIAQAQSTTCHPQTNSLMEGPNWTLV